VLDALGNFGDFIGGIAVLLTLIYLAIQIRNNTAEVKTGSDIARAEAYARSVQSFSEFRRHIIDNPEVADLYLRGVNDLGSLNPTERLRFHLMLQQLFNTIHAVLLNAKATGMELSDPYKMLKMETIMKAPGVQEWWSREKLYFEPMLLEFIDNKGARANEPPNK
jgi:hypothetical protein